MMNFNLAQRTKHRITGVAVLLSIAIIFLPILLKKSNQRLEENMHVSIKLPAKPVLPALAIPSEKVLFNSVKVAHIKVPIVNKVAGSTPMVQAESLRSAFPVSKLVPIPVVSKASTVAKLPVKNNQLAQIDLEDISAKHLSNDLSAESKKPTKLETSSKAIVPSGQEIKIKQASTALKTKTALPATIISNLQKPNSSEKYVVQLASFSKQINAQLLVARLKSQGYHASYYTMATNQGSMYKVIVGQLNLKQQAVDVRKKLAENLKLEGFVTKAKVG